MANVIVHCKECGTANRVDRAKLQGAVAHCSTCRRTLQVPGPQSSVLLVRDRTFNERVLASTVPVFIYFCRATCGYCRRFEPVVAGMLPELAPVMLVARVDLDADPGLGARYHISGTPTSLVLEAGAVKDRIEGAVSADQLRYRLARYLR